MKKINYKGFNILFLIISSCFINLGCEGEQYCTHERKTKMSDCGGITVEKNNQKYIYGVFLDTDGEERCFYMKDNALGESFNGLCYYSERVYVDMSNCNPNVCRQLGS